jgi:hypothetical protein
MTEVGMDDGDAEDAEMNVDEGSVRVVDNSRVSWRQVGVSNRVYGSGTRLTDGIRVTYSVTTTVVGEAYRTRQGQHLARVFQLHKTY